MAKRTMNPHLPEINGATLGFEQELWRATDALRGSMDAAEYKHVVLGLIFLKYISDAFEEHRQHLLHELYADPEDPDEYRAVDVFWVPREARWERRQIVRNANFAWVQHIIHHLAPTGYAGFVLANGSMPSNQSGEGEIRKNIIEADLLDCMVALPGQLFYSTQIPACLWFLARDKSGRQPAGQTQPLRDRRGQVLFVDARKMGRMVDCTHRELTDEDIPKIAATYHAWRGETVGAGLVPAQNLCLPQKGQPQGLPLRWGMLLVRSNPGRRLYIHPASNNRDGIRFPAVYGNATITNTSSATRNP